MQRGSPWAGGGLNDSQLQHVVKLLAGDIQTLRRQAAGMGMNWRASGGDVVLDRVFDGGSKVRTPLTRSWVME